MVGPIAMGGKNSLLMTDGMIGWLNTPFMLGYNKYFGLACGLLNLSWLIVFSC